MSNIQKGFSLIELMIAVAVIGVLAVIGIVQYDTYIARAQAAHGVAALNYLSREIDYRYASGDTSILENNYVSSLNIDGGNYIECINLWSGISIGQVGNVCRVNFNSRTRYEPMGRSAAPFFYNIANTTIVVGFNSNASRHLQGRHIVKKRADDSGKWLCGGSGIAFSGGGQTDASVATVRLDSDKFVRAIHLPAGCKSGAI